MNMEIQDQDGRPVDFADLDEDTMTDVMNFELAYKRGWRAAVAAAAAAYAQGLLPGQDGSAVPVAAPTKAAPVTVPAEPFVIQFVLPEGMKVTSLPDRVTTRTVSRDNGLITGTVDVETDA